MTRSALVLMATALLAPPVVTAQSLDARIAAATAPNVRFTYAARPGVCGSSGGGIVTHDRDDGWQSDCGAGPIRLQVTHEGGTVTRLRVHVGGHWATTANTTDLGTVSAREASDWLLALAGRETGAVDEVANDAILGATLADSVVTWPRLLVLAKTQAVPIAARRSATFWLGQAAGEAATTGLVEIVDHDGSREVREAAVFALSQRPRDEGVPALIRIARTQPDPSIRKKAIFWLGQANDPRALAYFEEVLTNR
jgi:hypothetical protein